MKTIRRLVAAAALCTGMGGATLAYADPLPDSQGATISFPLGNLFSGNYNVGWLFDLGTAYNVTHLGYLDIGTDGAIDHDVAIYACVDAACLSGTLVVSATVASTDPLQNSFRWVEIAATPLVAGRYVVSGVAGTEMYQYSGLNVTFDPSVTWLAGRYEEGSTLVFPDETNPPSNNPAYSYFGPNFGTAAVPEPGTIALVGLGLMGFGLRRRKQA